nr:hypothetical protein GCM10020093_065790 [Planobispora longispora]
MPDPVEKVWPEAVWKIPAELPGGREFHPQAFIDDRTLLLETSESFEKADAIYSYDLAERRIRKIADISTPKGVFASGYTVGNGLIVWQTIDEADGDESTAPRTTEFWSVPVEGASHGHPHGPPAEGRGRQAHRDRGQARLLPRTGRGLHGSSRGGTVEPVPGADRHHILRWPWVGTPGRHPQDGETAFGELFNVETGAVDEAVVRPGERNVKCDVTACVGSKPDGRSAFFRLRDGSRERDIPGESFAGLASDRFRIVHLPVPRGGQYLHDPITGKSGDLGIRADADGSSIAVHAALGDDRLVAYPIEDEYVIIDLSKIGE